jgi:hypothetical protein
MSVWINLQNIQNNIANFNLKKTEIVNFVNRNKITKNTLSIQEIPIISLHNLNLPLVSNSIKDIKNNLLQIKKEIKSNLETTFKQSNTQLKIESNTECNNCFDIDTFSNRYIKQYINSDNMFWGIGLENECYLQANPKKILGKNIVQMLGRERYSVDYTLNYNIEQVKYVMSKVYSPNKLYLVSHMLNAHSFNKMDRNLEHITTYEKEPKLNSKFSGKTILEEWCEYDDEISSKINSKIKTETNIFFDGDTIEFITEKFYKSNTESVVEELLSNKNWFIEKFNKFKKDTELWSDIGEIVFPKLHPGINIFNSHKNKVVFFNNTTIHLHLTLPTKIKNGIILDKNNFDLIHAKAIKLLQWFEPFFICTLGSPDILQLVYEKYLILTKHTQNKINQTNHTKTNTFFARGSMRATISRYIGIGTFNTDQMIMGKLLTLPIQNARPKNVLWWRDMINEDLSYNLPKIELGFDFNYGKHYQSGLEFRILDGIPMEILKDVLDIIVLICEHSYNFSSLESIQNSSTSQTWNNIVYKSIVYGYNAVITQNEILDFLQNLNLDFNSISDLSSELNLNLKKEINLEEFYYKIIEYLFSLYKNKDTHALQYLTKNFNKINKWNNFNKMQYLAHIESLESV